jgi:hypothetical protein
MVNMGKEMGRTCRAAHSALLRRVVGLRLQSFAVQGWGCPSHWTRLPSLLSANMRLPLGIVDFTRRMSRIWSSMQRFTRQPRWCARVRSKVRLFSSASRSTATSSTTQRQGLCPFLSGARIHRIVGAALGADGPAGEGPIFALLCVRPLPGVVLGAGSAQLGR